ncbi:hypothetical protein AAMO2058_001286300 [Amorphochlora amoebiformis]
MGCSKSRCGCHNPGKNFEELTDSFKNRQKVYEKHIGKVRAHVKRRTEHVRLALKARSGPHYDEAAARMYQELAIADDRKVKQSWRDGERAFFEEQNCKCKEGVIDLRGMKHLELCIQITEEKLEEAESISLQELYIIIGVNFTLKERLIEAFCNKVTEITVERSGMAIQLHLREALTEESDSESVASPHAIRKNKHFENNDLVKWELTATS